MSFMQTFKELSQAAEAAGWTRTRSQETILVAHSVYWTSPDGETTVELDHETREALVYPSSARVCDNLTRQITSWDEVAP